VACAARDVLGFKGGPPFRDRALATSRRYIDTLIRWNTRRSLARLRTRRAIRMYRGQSQACFISLINSSQLAGWGRGTRVREYLCTPASIRDRRYRALIARKFSVLIASRESPRTLDRRRRGRARSPREITSEMEKRYYHAL